VFKGKAAETSARTALAALVLTPGTGEPKAPANRPFLVMERTGIEPVTSGLQTHPIARLHLTPTNRIGITEPNQPSHQTEPDTVRRRSARTSLARPLPKLDGHRVVQTLGLSLS
jgi:hypothetical protein